MMSQGSTLGREGTYDYLHLLYYSVYVKDSIESCTDYGLVFQDGYLSIKHMAHVAWGGGVTEYKARRDILKGVIIINFRQAICTETSHDQFLFRHAKCNCYYPI